MLDSAWLFAVLLALADVVAAALAGELLVEPLVELLPELLQAVASKHAIGIMAISTRRRVFIRLLLTPRTLVLMSWRRQRTQQSR
jgi:hypothetical protein